MSPSPRPRGAAPRPRHLAPKLVLASLLTLVLAEALLHLVPALLPGSFRSKYPLHGVGFFEPGLLDATPVERVPMPLYVGDHVGPPPADLVELGLAPEAAAAADRARVGDVEVRVDAVGLPNPAIPATADVVFVGDSFAVSAGVDPPPGLVRRFRDETGLSTYNLGVAALGPFQEHDLLRRFGLPKKPRVVVWMFFGGNDLTDALMTLYHRHEGRTTWGEVHGDRRPPRFRLLAVLRHLRGRRIDAHRTEPLPGLELPGAAQPVWFHPAYLRSLARTRAEWEADPAYAPTLGVLDEAAAEVEAAGARLLFVYLPSKAQALLPAVEQDAERLHALARFPAQELPLDAEAFLAAARLNAGALEASLRDACAERGIPFLSATPLLEAGARAGEPGYLVADTHWNTTGQEQLLPALVEAVRGLLD